MLEPFYRVHTGRTAIRPSIIPNCLQSFCQQQPVAAGMLHQLTLFTSLCCKLVSDQFSIRFGNASLGQKFPKLYSSRPNSRTSTLEQN